MKYFAFLSVAMLLSSVQWLTVTSVEVMPNILTNKATNELYQGDIVLTDEQRRALVARKAINDIRSRWPKSADGTVNIDYRFADTVVNRPGVLLAMSRWEKTTCVKFRMIAASVAKPHLIFKTSATSCQSYVGQLYDKNGQDVDLMPSCFNGGEDTVVHELGHALGLWHEQSRSDRDNYLYIMLANVEPKQKENFGKENSNNYGLPYDYSSIMQYGPKDFSVNGRNTIVAKDPLAQPLIENHQGLSFMDKKIVNLMYKCTNTWLAKCKLAADPCKNQGYTKSNCLCECPPGTSGAKCETLNRPYIDALIYAKSPGSQRITTEGTVTSPGYPTPVTKATSRILSIQAPACQKVKLTFVVFDMQACSDMSLEIKLDDPPVTGTKYCGASIKATQTFQSAGRFMVLTFSSKAMAKNTKTGYKATVKFVSGTKCRRKTHNATTTATESTTTHTKTSNTTSTTTHKITSKTTAVPSAGTFINSGRLPFTSSKSDGQCSLVSSANPSVYFYRSPNYPGNYSSEQRCTMWFNMAEPRYLKATPLTLKLGPSDSADLLSAYKTTAFLDANTVGIAITLPTSASRLNFQASPSSPGGKFDIQVEVVNTDCHQLIKLDAGSTGPLSIPANYPPGTVCEWWLNAPAGRKVQVSFSRFSIGVSTCLRDSVVIDLTGDSRYVTKATRYCGGNASSPGTVVSTGNALNILVNGQWGNYQGLDATYTVV